MKTRDRMRLTGLLGMVFVFMLFGSSCTVKEMMPPVVQPRLKPKGPLIPDPNLC